MSSPRSDHNQYSNNMEYCKITEHLPEDEETDKCVIVLPGLMYRTHFAVGDLSSIVLNKQAAYVHFDYPKGEFVMEKVIKQLKDYIESTEYGEIVLIGISFGDIIYRELLNTLSESGKAKIVHHISLNGVSSKDELSVKFKIALSLAKLKSPVINDIVATFGIINRKFHGKLTNNQVYNNEFKKKIKQSPGNKEQLMQKQKWHQKSASLGFTSGYADRARVIAQGGEIKQTDVPSSLIYSSNDEFFSQPKRNAEKIGATIDPNEVTYYEIEKGGHMALVEYPEKYNPTLEDIFSSLGWENIENT